jgi:hypothetical protein
MFVAWCSLPGFAEAVCLLGLDFAAATMWTVRSSPSTEKGSPGLNIIFQVYVDFHFFILKKAFFFSQLLFWVAYSAVFCPAGRIPYMRAAVSSVSLTNILI